jgi:ribosome-associated protein
MFAITDKIVIDQREIEERFIRASGPGGQNVNKLATAVQLRFDAAGSPALDEATKARLKRRAGRRMTAEGIIVITAQRFRTQERNRRDALERLIALLRLAAEEPRERVATKPSRAAREQRLKAKARRSRTKSLRSQGPSMDES